jgi:hypothetical protein
MNLSTNDFANRELSMEELEAIAAGGFFGDAWNFIKHEVHDVVHWAGSAKGIYTLAIVVGTIIGGVAYKKQ